MRLKRFVASVVLVLTLVGLAMQAGGTASFDSTGVGTFLADGGDNYNGGG